MKTIIVTKINDIIIELIDKGDSELVVVSNNQELFYIPMIFHWALLLSPVDAKNVIESLYLLYKKGWIEGALHENALFKKEINNG